MQSEILLKEGICGTLSKIEFLRNCLHTAGLRGAIFIYLKKIKMSFYIMHMLNHQMSCEVQYMGSSLLIVISREVLEFRGGGGILTESLQQTIGFIIVNNSQA